MVRLVLGLCVAILAVLVFVGADRGQQRLGLAGGYRLATGLPPSAPPAVPAPPLVAAPALGSEVPAVFLPAQPVRTPLAAEPQPASQPAGAVARDIRRVVARAVNVRGGPSAGDAVIDRLAQGEEVLVVAGAGEEWLHIRIEGDGVDGFVAARFLGPVE